MPFPKINQIYIFTTASQQPVAINLTNTGGGAKILTSNQQSTISRVVTSNVPFTYGSDQTSSVTSTVSSTAQLIASAANALASSSQIQQQISGNSTITTISGAKISLPTQPARFVALPTQPATMVKNSFPNAYKLTFAQSKNYSTLILKFDTMNY